MFRLATREASALLAAVMYAKRGGATATTAADGHDRFKSRLGRTVRQQVYEGSSAAPPGAEPRTPKEERLVEMWREEPNTGTMSAAEAEAAAARASTVDVATAFGATFRDQRAIDPNESEESKRRRLIFQSRYRGMVEMDLVFGHFARCKLDTLEATLLDEYDTLLKQLDNDLFNWLVMGHAPPQAISDLKCFHEVKRFVEKERKELLGYY